MNNYKQFHSYSLQLVNVKMKVKFQCKMRIQHNGQPLTTDVSPINQNLFQFNHNVTLAEDPNNNAIILTLSLVTGKGAKYIAAQAYLYYNQLVQADGNRLVVSLTKCLDPQAQMQLKVNGVIFSKVEAAQKVDTLEHKFTQLNDKYLRQKRQQPQIINSPHVGTRSQAHYQIHNKAIDQRTYYRSRKDQLGRSRSKSRSIIKHKYTQPPTTTIQPKFGNEPDPVIYNLRDKYKESYDKLKSRLKNESDRSRNEFEHKLALQNNEVLMKMKMKYSVAANELQLSNQKIRNLQNTYQSELSKMNSQILKLKNELEGEKTRKAEEKQKSSRYQLQLNQSQMKIKFVEDKYEKENRNLNDKLSEKQRQLKYSKEENTKLLQKLNRLTEKQHQYCHNYEHLNHQKQSYHRMIKQMQQQLSEYKNKMKDTEHKNIELAHQQNWINQTKQQMNSKFRRLEEENYKLQSMHNKANSQLQKALYQIAQAQKHTKKLQSDLQDKNNKIIQHKNAVSEEGKALGQAKEKLLRAQLDIQNTSKQFYMFKEYLLQTINSSFSQIQSPLKQLTQYAQSSPNYYSNTNQVNYSSNHSYPPPPLNNTNNKEQKVNNSQLLNQIRGYSKQYKVLINKLAQQCKHLQKENSTMKEQLAQGSKKQEQELKRYQDNVHNLQEQLSNLCEQINEKEGKYKQETQFYKFKVQEMELQLNNVKLLNEEHVFNINGLKMDRQSQSQIFTTTITQLKRKVTSFQERVRELQVSEQSLQNIKHNLQIQKQKLQEQVQHLNEENNKKEQTISQYEYSTSLKDKEIEEYKANKKKNTSYILQLQMLLNNQKQMNSKYNDMLSEEEKKGQCSKQFINDLIKQKETLLKSDLAKSQNIIQLQTKVQALQESTQTLTQQVNNKQELYAQEKANNKKLTLNIKELQEQKQQLTEKHKKLTERYEDKEKELRLLSACVEENEEKYRVQLQSRNKDIKQLREQIQVLQGNRNSSSLQYNNKYNSALQEVENRDKTISQLKKEIEYKVQEILLIHNSIQQKDNQLQYVKNAIKEQQRRAKQLHRKCQQIEEQLKIKEEIVYGLSGEKFALQSKLQEKEYLYKEELYRINENNQFKIQSIQEDYENKIQEIQKEKDYHRMKCVEYEQEITKLKQNIKVLQIEENNERNLNKEKYKRLDQEKNNIIHSIKLQVEHLQQEVRTLQESEKKKNTEIENLRNVKMANLDTNNRLQNKIKEYDKRIETIQNGHFNEIQSYNKRQLQYRKYEENVSNCQWVIEREIRKQLQNFTHRIISSVETEGDKKVLMECIRQMQKSVLRIVEHKMIQVK